MTLTHIEGDQGHQGGPGDHAAPSGGNLLMRMGMRRSTRLTNSFSKKVENHAPAVSLDMMWMKFGRAHKSVANPYPGTPAMAAGVADHMWTCEEIAALID